MRRGRRLIGANRSAAIEHLHRKPAALKPLVGLSEATMARRGCEQMELDPVASERLDRLMEVVHPG
jgi:hypothetical protein